MFLSFRKGHVYSCHWEAKCSVTFSIVEYMLAVCENMERVPDIKDS